MMCQTLSLTCSACIVCAVSCKLKRSHYLGYAPKIIVILKKCSFSKVFEEPEDPSSRSFFSEIISSISDVKFSHSGRYMMTRDYLSVKVWDLNMENRPVETYQVIYFDC